MTHASAELPVEDIAAAFERLRREVSLTRSAVEGLTAARERVPDYSVTLGKMAGTLAENAAGIGRIEASPAVRLTPAVLSQEIIKASTSAREDDARRHEAAHEALVRSIERIDGIVERGQAAGRQSRRQIWSTVGGSLAGVVIWSMLPGALARSAPESWHVPEWMAARTMGMDKEEAGRRLIARARNEAKRPGS